MCARLSGSFYDCQSPLERLVMVAGHLGNDEGRLIESDKPVVDRDPASHFAVVPLNKL